MHSNSRGTRARYRHSHSHPPIVLSVRLMYLHVTYSSCPNNTSVLVVSQEQHCADLTIRSQDAHTHTRRQSGRHHGHGNDEASEVPVWCRATVGHLTSRLAAVAATCQHSNEHMLKVVVVGEGEIVGRLQEVTRKKFTKAESEGETKPFTHEWTAWTQLIDSRPQVGAPIRALPLRKR